MQEPHEVCGARLLHSMPRLAVARNLLLPFCSLLVLVRDARDRVLKRLLDATRDWTPEIQDDAGICKGSQSVADEVKQNRLYLGARVSLLL